jgi:hypothetical protein
MYQGNRVPMNQPGVLRNWLSENRTFDEIMSRRDLSQLVNEADVLGTSQRAVQTDKLEANYSCDD